ncbi:MAG: GNAT family protein [Rhodospirillaceae bacterium]|nr:GNAT family protein [Rhodospirillaceae bacterium]
MTELNTQRLTGRLIADSDVARLRLLHNDERVMATLSADGQKLPHAVSKRILAKFMVEGGGELGRGVWVFHTRSDGMFTGYAGILPYMADGLNEHELLYAVPFLEWGKGYATEMATAVTENIFNASRLSEIVAMTLPTNAKSRRVMEKLGFDFERDMKKAGLDHVLYRLTRRVWTARATA